MKFADPNQQAEMRTFRIVEKYGKEYKPAILPAEIKRGLPGDCFDWSAVLASKHHEYKYVEGFATNPEDPEEYCLHAWLTDGEHAFDPTWQAVTNNGEEKPVPAYYVGIEFDIYDVAEFMITTGYKSLLGNRWRNEQLWRKILKRTVKKRMAYG